MTNKETEIHTLIYALGDAIQVMDWTRARLIWERLQNTYSPLADSHPYVDQVLLEKEALLRLAERAQSKLVH